MGETAGRLETMTPAEGTAADVSAAVREALGHEGLTYKVWGGDWCPDCTGQLPRFAAALEAAGVPADRIEQCPVEKIDGEKQGPEMETYGVEYIPTVIVFDDDGEELARFVESAETDIATYLARELSEE